MSWFVQSQFEVHDQDSIKCIYHYTLKLLYNRCAIIYSRYSWGIHLPFLTKFPVRKVNPVTRYKIESRAISRNSIHARWKVYINHTSINFISLTQTNGVRYYLMFWNGKLFLSDSILKTYTSTPWFYVQCNTTEYESDESP